MGAYRKEVRVAATIVDESDGSTSEMEFISDSRTDIITIWIDGMEYSIVRTEFNSFVMHLNQMV